MRDFATPPRRSAQRTPTRLRSSRAREAAEDRSNIVCRSRRGGLRMTVRIGAWMALVVVGLVASCAADEGEPVPAGADGGNPDGSSPADDASASDSATSDGAVTSDAELDARDASNEAGDAALDADGDAGPVYSGAHVWSRLYGEPDSLAMSSPAMVPGPLGSATSRATSAGRSTSATEAQSLAQARTRSIRTLPTATSRASTRTALTCGARVSS